MTDDIALPYDNPKEAALVAEYEAWLKEQGLEDDTGSADELALHPDITPEQNRWLADFIKRWNAEVYGEDPEDAERWDCYYCEQHPTKRSECPYCDNEGPCRRCPADRQKGGVA